MFSDYLLSMETITSEMIVDYVEHDLSSETENNKDKLKDFRAGLHYEARKWLRNNYTIADQMVQQSDYSPHQQKTWKRH